MNGLDWQSQHDGHGDKRRYRSLTLGFVNRSFEHLRFYCGFVNCHSQSFEDMNEECPELLRLGLSTVRRFALQFGDWLCFVSITLLRQELGSGLEINQDVRQFRVMITMEVEQFLEDIAAIESAWMREEFSTSNDFEHAPCDSIGDTTARITRIDSLAGVEVVLSTPVHIALDEIVSDEHPGRAEFCIAEPGELAAAIDFIALIARRK